MLCILRLDVMRKVSSQDKLSHPRVNKLCLSSLMKVPQLAVWSCVQCSRAVPTHGCVNKGLCLITRCHWL